MSITEKQEEIVKEFDELIEWEDKYKKIIEMGKSLPALDENIN